MNPRSQAITILQQARDALSERLTQRIIDAQAEIEADAEGSSYLSEIETIYEQLGGRLAHVNAMLSNLPPQSGMAPADATASEIVYADLASASSASFDLEATAPMTLLALPAPSDFEEHSHAEPTVKAFAQIVLEVQADDLTSASRLIADWLDIKPSDARRAVAAFARRLANSPELAWRTVDLDATLESTNEYVAAALLGDYFEFQPLESLAIVRALRKHPGEGAPES